MILLGLLSLLSIVRFASSTSSASIFESSTRPQTYLMASVGNGYIATTVYSPVIYVSGIFNGRGTTSPSHRARIPSPADVSLRTNVGVVSNSVSNLYRLNVSEGVFYRFQNAQNFVLEQKVYAHRVQEHIFVSEVTVSNKMGVDILLAFDTRFDPKDTDDFDFKIYSEREKKYLERFYLRERKTFLTDYSAMSGYIKETEEAGSPKLGVAVVWSKIPRKPVTVPKSTSMKWCFITAVASTLDSQDILHGAYKAYEDAVRDMDGLLASHVTAWTKLWGEGRVEMDGNLPLAQAVYGSLYYILSSIRHSWPHGLSPGGLASNGYNGHTFWDQETWMYPPLLMLYPDIARSCLQYRVDRLEVARQRAKARSYSGAMFPWESAVTGNEVCPGDIYSDYEQHITGDIGFAAKQYYQATRDLDWLRGAGSQLIHDTAEFWASRVTFNQSRGAYDIYDVMPPDEDRGIVNNSVFTNVIAKLNLEFAGKVLKNVPANWSEIAKKMFIPFDKTKQYHPEYEGYDLSIQVKQADVILLGFPLLYPMTSQVRRNDLTLYEPRTDPSGPAMTKSMFAINWLDIGDTGNAVASFNESYANVKEPFKVWTETPEGGAVNFITGAGGFLQAVLSGYCGLKLHDEYLEFNPRLLPATTQVRLFGVNYLGNSIDIAIGSNSSYVTVTSRKGPVLQAVVLSSGQHYTLESGHKVELPNGMIRIQTSSRSTNHAHGKQQKSRDVLGKWMRRG